MNGDCECNITITTEAIPQVTVKEEVVQVVEVSTGIPGIDGVGVPVGGNTGDYLQKKTNTDFDTEWKPAPIVSITKNGFLTKEQYAQLGFDMAREISTPTFSKELIFTLGVLTKIIIWEDPSHAVKMYEKTFSYSSGNLTSVATKRMSDNAIFTKTLSYTSGSLTQVDGA